MKMRHCILKGLNTPHTAELLDSQAQETRGAAEDSVGEQVE